MSAASRCTIGSKNCGQPWQFDDFVVLESILLGCMPADHLRL